MPKVSVITPVGEWAFYVERAVKSVLLQGEIVGELLLIDNAIVPFSKCDVPELEFLKSLNRIKILSSDKPRSPASARNIGLANAQYEYCAVLDSDDEYLAGHLDRAVNALEKSNAEFYCCSYINRASDYPDSVITVNTEINTSIVITDCRLGHSTSVFKAKLGVRYPEIGRRHDYAMWLVLVKNNPDLRFVFSEEIGVIRHKRSGSLSSVSIVRLLLKQYMVTLLFSGLNPFLATFLQAKFIVLKIRKILCAF